MVLYSAFFFTSKFSSLYFFLSLIIVFLKAVIIQSPKVLLMENLYNSICGSSFPELSPPLVRWFVLEIPQEAISHINSR